MLFENAQERLQIEGIMPERALLRLKRAGISLYNLRKTDKNRILFSVKRKDIQKVFAIYPNICYNDSAYHPYTLRKVGGSLGSRTLAFCKKRVGFCLGLLAFGVITLAADDLVLGIELTGNTVYYREVEIALKESGIRPFSFYDENREAEAEAKLLALPSIEFCEVQKRGRWVRVELRKAPLSTESLQKESMTAKHSGVVEAIVALRGTPLKKAGDSVAVGEPLVGNFLEKEEGEKVFVEPMARVRIACEYKGIFPVEMGEEAAFAESYLALELGAKDEITSKEITQTAEGIEVKILYTVLETVNF